MRLRSVVAAVVLALACGLVAGCGRAPGRTPAAESRAPRTPPSAPPVVTPTGRLYAVAAPNLDSPAGGPFPDTEPACTPAQVSVTATSVRAADGVLGLVTVTAHRCALQVEPAGLRLLDAAGRPVTVARGAPTPTNPPGEDGRDVAEHRDAVHVGFAWTGGGCVTGPVTVELPALPGPVRARLVGPLPGCSANGRDAVGTLVPGTVAAAAIAVEPPPAAWQHLRVRLVLPATVRQGTLPASVVVSNAGTSEVTLSAPCPAYAVTTSVVLRPGPASGAVSMGSVLFGNLCGRGPLVVAAGRSLTLPVPTTAGNGEDRWQPGTGLDMTWAMAGVPTAETTAVVR